MSPGMSPMPSRTLLLFDVDGVLVQAHGYLRALQDTVAHISQAMGVGAHPPTEGEVRAFEAQGVTSEWDSAPACVAALLIDRLRRAPELRLPPDWPAALAALAAHPLPLPHPDYAELAAAVGARMSAPGHTPAEVAQAARAVLAERAGDLPQHQREAVHALLAALLGHTHDFDRAPITQHFQHRVIGSDGVEATYGVRAAFSSPPYLREHDRPLLAEAVRERLLALLSDGSASWGAVLYTARPSLPPADSGVDTHGYSPEAELARALVKLARLPLIGLGRLRWLAAVTGGEVARMVKPSPVQALAAIGAAASGAEVAALRAAHAFHAQGRLEPPLADLGPTTVHVFEDATTGLRAAQAASAALAAAGMPVQGRYYGVTPATGPKARAMAALGVPTYRSVNAALGEVLRID